MAVHLLNPQYEIQPVTISPIDSYTIIAQNCFKYRGILSIWFRLGNCASIAAKKWTYVATTPFAPTSSLDTFGGGYGNSNFSGIETRFSTDGKIGVWPVTTGYTEMYFYAVLQTAE